MTFCWTILVIVIVIVFSEPPCERINGEGVGSSVLGAHRHDKPSAPHDLNVCPSISHQFLSDLIFSYRPVALDEDWAAVALGYRDRYGSGDGKGHSTRNGPYNRSFHGSFSWYAGVQPLPESADKHAAFKAGLSADYSELEFHLAIHRRDIHGVDQRPRRIGRLLPNHYRDRGAKTASKSGFA